MSTDVVIQLNKLTFRYEPDKPNVLEKISFSINKGEVFGLLGPSGAGKSTTQKILIGLLKNHSGQAEILGKNIQQWNNELYEHIGVSFELPNHFLKLTALENLEYFASLYRHQRDDVMCLLHWVGLEEAAHQRVSGFSKGMKNRLSLARALVHDPQVIFLDEPTAGLDPVSTLRVQELISTLKEQGKTILINTHNMHIADDTCDQVAFIYQGKIAEMGEPSALRLKYGQPVVKVEYTDQGKTKFHTFPLEDLGDNLDFIRIIKKYPIKTLHSSEASLDQVFRKVTGFDVHNNSASSVGSSMGLSS